MISDARGGHVSPGIYTEEKDVTYAAKSLGITSLGLVGETVKGPAFQPITIEDWSEFTDYFGGMSTEKFKGTGLPKYELPYIANSYLEESKRLNVVRVLGLSGYKTSPAYVVTAKFGEKDPQPVVVLRSKGDYSDTVSGSTCEKAENEKFTPYVVNFKITEYVGSEYGANCEISDSAYTIPLSGKVKESNGSKIVVSESGASGETREIGSFGIEVTYKAPSTSGSGATVHYNVSLDPYAKNYIYNVFSIDPLVGTAPLFIEAVYDYAYDAAVQNAEEGTVVVFSGITVSKEQYKDFQEPYRCAQTPWIVSEVKDATATAMNLKKLFKFYTISDGNAANYQVKVSIQKIRPDEGLFDVWVRDFYDTDTSPVVLEKFSNLTMVEGDTNYIGLKIGTYDGGYEAKSKYITVEISDEDGIESCVPCGFLGYPMPTYGEENARIDMAYNTAYDDSVKPKRQYFGLNSGILDEDVLNYKGVNAYNNAKGDADPERITNGFHLDAILSMAKGGANNISGGTMSGSVIYVDGVSGFRFTTVDAIQSSASSTKLPRIVTEAFAENTIYEEIALRKFTVYPYGGFDGWDIYRNYRTNTNKFKATKYAIVSGCPFERIGSSSIATDPQINLNLPTNAITSDYYAYLAGYKQFANPSDVEINLFATPGIDFSNNSLLVEDALDMIEDQEDGRGGDALYIVTAPQYDIDESNSNGLASPSEDVLNADDVVDRLSDSEIKSSYACTYFPWVKFYDNSAKQYLNLPATKDVVRNMAMVDNTSYPWFAPAGVERGSVECVRALFRTTLSDEDTLYEDRINPIKTFGQDGVKLWGNKTLYTGDTPLNRINVRRLMLRVKKLVVDASKALIFEQYDSTLESQFKSLVEPILSQVKSNRGIADYRVVTESTAETRDQHLLPCRILIKPVQSLEYISISFTVYPESVDFDED